MKTIAHWTNKYSVWTAEFRDETGAPVTVGDSTEMPIYESNDLNPNLPIAERKLNALGLTFGHRDGNDIEVNGLPTMPALDGSEKQSAWANDLRARVLDYLTKPICKSSRFSDDLARYQQWAGWLRETAALHTDAAWWINKRLGGLVPGAVCIIAKEAIAAHPDMEASKCLRKWSKLARIA
jgi:hypothetical protein